MEFKLLKVRVQKEVLEVLKGKVKLRFRKPL